MIFPKVAFIIPYFGKLPRWFNIFIKTCSYNSDFSFIFFSDNPVTIETNNIYFNAFTLNDFNSLASLKLGFNIQITEPYKICDLKPAYGLIFEDYIKDFQYWGILDIDLILGNLKAFINVNILNEYDIITAKKEYLTGHFTIFRNCSKVNNLFTESTHYKYVFQSNTIFSFDECNSIWKHLLKGIPITAIPAKIDSMTHVVKRLEKTNSLKIYFENLVLEQNKLDNQGNFSEWNDTLSWNNGKLFNFNEKKEYLYFHFHFLKKKRSFIVPDWNNVPKQFYITNTGFF
ncbi:hypothetical protein DVR12_03585 [Chitinophaga silvatica]|uniref:Uncharacterized protein n=1 Tax=Chitinophaga silvatica TaxID=2282649 RepID=A0A3E1YHQ5_9BACT|nr:DUF6625 family protein [Chitinophaga silvatica]RFS26878.1 hypothetical protein DVR12_03585 [Chitinophaga silvatica]